jgi:6-phosphogluconolactonase
VVGNWAPSIEAWRMTLTYPVLNAGREVMFVVTGAEKAAAVRAIRSGQGDLPAGRVRARRTRWILDAAAGG